MNINVISENSFSGLVDFLGLFLPIERKLFLKHLSSTFDLDIKTLITFKEPHSSDPKNTISTSELIEEVLDIADGVWLYFLDENTEKFVVFKLEDPNITKFLTRRKV